MHPGARRGGIRGAVRRLTSGVLRRLLGSFFGRGIRRGFPFVLLDSGEVAATGRVDLRHERCSFRTAAEDCCFSPGTLVIGSCTPMLRPAEKKYCAGFD